MNQKMNQKIRFSGYQNYLENEVLSADPLKLVELLYRGALNAIYSARQHLAKREIRERSRAITRALFIVNELAASLDLARGGDVSLKLAGLYRYIGQLLVDANTGQTDAPLAEASQLLATLLPAWEVCAAQSAASRLASDVVHASI